MKKIVINRCFGGFGLSQEALIELSNLDARLVYQPTTDFLMEYMKDGFALELAVEDLRDGKLLRIDGAVSRENSKLIEVVEKLGSRASCYYSELKIVEIPDDVEYTIEEYDGVERVVEAHRTWS